MDLAFLHPLYEHPGPWASVYADTSRHTESTPHERSLMARAAATELAGQGADEATCQAVRGALEELRHSPEPHGRALFATARSAPAEERLCDETRHQNAKGRSSMNKAQLARARGALRNGTVRDQF